MGADNEHCLNKQSTTWQSLPGVASASNYKTNTDGVTDHWIILTLVACRKPPLKCNKHADQVQRYLEY